MKKFFIKLIAIMYLLSANSCWAFSELYYLKNVQKSDISVQVDNILAAENYSINKQNPYYAISIKKPENYAVIVLQQSGTNLFYYYDSNDKNKSFNKKFINTFKKQNIICEKSVNEMHLNTFSKIAQNTLRGEVTKYSFEEPVVYKISQNQVQQNNIQPTVLKGFVGKISRGTSFNAYLQSPINTANAKKCDEVIAILTKDWTYNNLVIAPQGSVVYGTLSKVNSATLGSRNGSVQIVFTKLVSPTGKAYDLISQKIDFNVTNEGKVMKTAKNVVGAALAGALVGLAVGAISGANVGKSAALGAAIGGGGSLVTNVVEQGVDAEIPSFTEIDIVLDKPLDVVLSY